MRLSDRIAEKLREGEFLAWVARARRDLAARREGAATALPNDSAPPDDEPDPPKRAA